MALDPRCEESFHRQGLMTLLGAKLVEAAEGRAVIEVPYREDLTQQHGYFHGGVVTAIADTACGYAAYTTGGGGGAEVGGGGGRGGDWIFRRTRGRGGGKAALEASEPPSAKSAAVRRRWNSMRS